MFIQHKEYLYLLDKIASLQDQVSLLKHQNHLLTQSVLKQREKHIFLQHNNIKRLQQMQMAEQIHFKTLVSQSKNNNQIIDKMNELNQQTKRLVLQKVSQLQKTSYIQLKNIQSQNLKLKLEHHEQKQFIDRLKKFYNESLPFEKQKKQPSLIEVMKWIKSLPGVHVQWQKLSLLNSKTVGNFKKQPMNMTKKKTISTKNKKKSQTPNLSQLKSRIQELFSDQKQNIQI